VQLYLSHKERSQLTLRNDFSIANCSLFNKIHKHKKINDINLHKKILELNDERYYKKSI